ncbi:MAG TPA: FHA domain-containing protein [Polyangiaceae bacterium]|nr:FHA domain-containing protein [Polyangiaceae bacterium]
MWLLAIEDDEGTTTFHRLSGDRCTLGRAPDNDVVLAQFNISRHHGRLEREGEGWRYFDQSSSNGSFFNGCRLLGSTLVGFDDALQLGGYRLTFREGLQTNVPTPRPYYVPPARLRVLAGPGEGTEYTFRRNEVVTIGRADECSVRLLHERIIGMHAKVRPLSGGRYEVVDESNRGIVVNGRRMACKVLEGGDTIALAGVSLLRYFERGQAPDPRFDHAISEGALEAAQAVGIDPFSRSGMYSITTEVAVPTSEPEGRVEMVGPKSLPAPAPVPISFKLAREATVLPKQRGRSHDRPSRRLSFTVETPARPVSLPTQTPRPARVPVERPEVLTPTGMRRDRVLRVIKRRRALEAAVAIAAVGSAVALARGVVRTTVEHAAALRPVAGQVAGVERPRLELNPAPAEGPSASARAKPPAPSTVAASEVRPVEHEPPAEAPAAGSAEPSASRSALEAHVRAGRASPAELRTLLHLCAQDGDDECVRRTREQLARGRQPR